MRTTVANVVEQARAWNGPEGTMGAPRGALRGVDRRPCQPPVRGRSDPTGRAGARHRLRLRRHDTAGRSPRHWRTCGRRRPLRRDALPRPAARRGPGAGQRHLRASRRSGASVRPVHPRCRHQQVRGHVLRRAGHSVRERRPGRPLRRTARAAHLADARGQPLGDADPGCPVRQPHLPEPPPNAPGPFGLADPEHVRRVLGQAGWSGVQVTEVRRAGPARCRS